VVVLELNLIVDAGKGLWTTTTTFLQYRPPKLTVARPNQTTPDVPAANTTAKNNQEVETQKLLAQNAALFAKLKP
jgi:hypothetical protein